MCSSFRQGQDNPSQKDASHFFQTELCCAVERSVRDFHSGRKSGNCMLIFKYRVDLDFPSVRRFCLEVSGKMNSLLVKKIMYSLILKVKEIWKSNFLFNLNLSGHKCFLSKMGFFYCTQHKINARHLTRPNINVVMECHDVSVQHLENDLHLQGRYSNGFSSTPVLGCFSSRKFNANAWLSIYLTNLASQ